MIRLPLFELDRREPVAHLSADGMLVADNRDALPQILFADVPVHMHLSAGVTLSPMRYASNQTGSEPRATDPPSGPCPQSSVPGT